MFMGPDAGKKFVNALEASGMKYADLARELDVSSQTVNNWRTRGVPASKANLVASILNVDPGEISVVASFNRGKELMRDVVSDATARYGPSDVTDMGTQMLPELDVSVSLGNGNYVDSVNQIIDHWPIEKRLLYKLGIEPEDAVLVRCTGDSMEDTISDGDLVVVDRGIVEPPWSGVYAIQSDKGIRIKRVNTRLDKSIEISSDNPNKSRYPTETYSSEFIDEIIHILGRAVRKYWGKIS